MHEHNLFIYIIKTGPGISEVRETRMSPYWIKNFIELNAYIHIESEAQQPKQ